MFFKQELEQLMQINIGIDLFELEQFFDSHKHNPGAGELASFDWLRDDIFD